VHWRPEPPPLTPGEVTLEGFFVGWLVRRATTDGIRRIAEECGVEVVMEQRREWLLKRLVVTLRGSPEAVDRAERLTYEWMAAFDQRSTITPSRS
jgi:hypothetical protein